LCRLSEKEGKFVKTKLLCVFGAALVAMLIVVPSVFAQETTMAKGEVKQKIEAETTVLQPTGGGAVGGPAVVLPAAAALLMGAGVLTYAVVRRR
jgi:hypothetical protein